MSNSNDEITSVKILVIGNSGVGKTSLCHRYINEIYVKAYKPTVGVEFCSKEMTVQHPSSKKFNIQFWDIGGQERYIHMTHVYYKNSDFCLVMFDLTNRESFKACAKWKADLDEKYCLDDGSNCPCLLIGNKCDLNDRVLEQSEIEDFCEEHGFYGFMEVSVKKNIMVDETIEYITDIIVKKKENDVKMRKYELVLKKDENTALCLDFNSNTYSNNKTKESKDKIGCFSLMHSSNCC